MHARVFEAVVTQGHGDEFLNPELQRSKETTFAAEAVKRYLKAWSDVEYPVRMASGANLPHEASATFILFLSFTSLFNVINIIIIVCQGCFLQGRGHHATPDPGHGSSSRDTSRRREWHLSLIHRRGIEGVFKNASRVGEIREIRDRDGSCSVPE